MAVENTTGKYTISTDNYLLGLTKLFPKLSKINFFDGPDRISHAATNTMTKKPKLEQMMYYNYYAASVYCTYELKNLSCFFCQNFKEDVNALKVLTNNIHNTIALVTVSDSRKEIVVTYRGTKSAWNVILDCMFVNVHIGDEENSIKIYRGFYMAAWSLYGDVVQNVGYQRTLHKNYKIVIVGHSLSGAMARITVFLLLHFNQFPGATYEIYTYGEPRVGNKNFVDFLNAQDVTAARIVARADVIPNLPPTSTLSTNLLYDYYIHPQNEFWINGEDKQRFCDEFVYEDPTCSDSLGPLYSAVDHVTYFDVNYLTCFMNQPFELLALPFNILPPVGKLPQMSKPISNFIGRATNVIVDCISPILGR